MEAAFGKHLRQKALLFEKLTRLERIAVKEPDGHKSGGHDFGGRQSGVFVVFVSVNLEKRIAKVINCDNLGEQGCSFWK